MKNFSIMLHHYLEPKASAHTDADRARGAVWDHLRCSRELMCRWQPRDASKQFRCSSDPLIFIISDNFSETPSPTVPKKELTDHVLLCPSHHCHFFGTYLFLIITSSLWEQEMPVARATRCDASGCVSLQTLCSESWGNIQIPAPLFSAADSSNVFPDDT